MTQEADFGRVWEYVGRSATGEELGRWSGGADVEALAYFSSTVLSQHVELVEVYRIDDASAAYVGTVHRTVAT